MQADGRHAPSYPTKRSRLLRDGAFALSFLVWGGAMYAIHRESTAQVVATEAAELKGVFSESFEPHLRLRVTATGAGVQFTGRGRRLTRVPYEGRKRIVESGSATGKVMGQSVSFEFESTQCWDIRTGLVSSRTKAMVRAPGMPGIDFDLTSSREGDFLVTRGVVLGEELATPIVKPYPKEADLVAGLLEPARASPLEVGSRWTELSVEAGLTGDVRVVPCEVEVVERVDIHIAGRNIPALRAVASVQSETGRPREYSRWYDVSGRCLRQQFPLSLVEVVVEREDLPRGLTGSKTNGGRRR